MQIKGICYRRDELPGTGDELLSPGNDKRIVTAAIKPEENPGAPHILLIREGKRRAYYAGRLCNQSTPISVYLKRGPRK